MASISSSSVALVFIIIFAAVNTLAHAQFTNQQILSVIGRLCCNGTSVNCPGPPLAGVNVTVTCAIRNNASFVFGQGTTNANGTFNITGRLGLNVPPVWPPIRPPVWPPFRPPVSPPFWPPVSPTTLPCVATVQLPILNNKICPVLATLNGTAVGVPQGLGLLPRAVVLIFITVPRNP